jgi:hypothetical protein
MRGGHLLHHKIGLQLTVPQQSQMEFLIIREQPVKDWIYYKNKTSIMSTFNLIKPLLLVPLLCNLRWAIHDLQLRKAMHLWKYGDTRNEDLQGNLPKPSKQ